MRYENRLREFVLAVVSVVPIAAAFVAPPAIAKRGAGADAGAVINACERAKYCIYNQDPKTGSLNGCDAQTGTCFTCPTDGSHKCYQTRQSPTGKHGSGRIGEIKLIPAPRGYHSSTNVGGLQSPVGGQSRFKAAYGHSTGPTNPNGPDIPGKGEGSFKSVQQHHR
jgi:hypothetical protein